MHRSSSLPSAGATATLPAPNVPHALLTRGPPAGSGWEPTGTGAAEVIRHLADDRDRIAQGMNDVVVHRIFAAGLDLQAALGLIGDHRGASKIYHAIVELDQAIRDVRDTIFGLRPCEPRSSRGRGGPAESRLVTSPDLTAILGTTAVHTSGPASAGEAGSAPYGQVVTGGAS